MHFSELEYRKFQLQLLSLTVNMKSTKSIWTWRVKTNDGSAMVSLCLAENINFLRGYPAW